MDAADNATDSAKLHVSTLLIASERALTNALEELGFAEDDDRVIQHEGRLAFLTCSHDPDCDDLFALISELAARGETWELQFRVDTGEGRAVFQRLARHQSVEALDAELPPDTEESDKELPVHDVDADSGRATAVVLRRNPRRALAMASGADEASLRAAIREILPTVMFAVAMKPPGS